MLGDRSALVKSATGNFDCTRSLHRVPNKLAKQVSFKKEFINHSLLYSKVKISTSRNFNKSSGQNAGDNLFITYDAIL